MKRRALCYILSAASVYVTMSYMINAFISLFDTSGSQSSDPFSTLNLRNEI